MRMRVKGKSHPSYFLQTALLSSLKRCREWMGWSGYGTGSGRGRGTADCYLQGCRVIRVYDYDMINASKVDEIHNTKCNTGLWKHRHKAFGALLCCSAGRKLEGKSNEKCNFKLQFISYFMYVCNIHCLILC